MFKMNLNGTKCEIVGHFGILPETINGCHHTFTQTWPTVEPATLLCECYITYLLRFELTADRQGGCTNDWTARISGWCGFPQGDGHKNICLSSNDTFRHTVLKKRDCRQTFCFIPLHFPCKKVLSSQNSCVTAACGLYACCQFRFRFGWMCGGSRPSLNIISYCNFWFTGIVVKVVGFNILNISWRISGILSSPQAIPCRWYKLHVILQLKQ